MCNGFTDVLYLFSYRIVQLFDNKTDPALSFFRKSRVNTYGVKTNSYHQIFLLKGFFFFLNNTVKRIHNVKKKNVLFRTFLEKRILIYMRI